MREQELCDNPRLQYEVVQPILAPIFVARLDQAVRKGDTILKEAGIFVRAAFLTTETGPDF